MGCTTFYRKYQVVTQFLDFWRIHHTFGFQFGKTFSCFLFYFFLFFISSFFHFYVSVIADSFIFWVVSLTHNCHNFLRSRFFTCYICFFIFQQNWPHCYWYCYFNLLSFSQTAPDLKLIGCSMIIFQFVGNKAKGWILKRVFWKKKAAKFPEKWTILTP